MHFLALEKYGLKFTFEKIWCADLAEIWTRAVFYDYLKMYVGYLNKKWQPFFKKMAPFWQFSIFLIFEIFIFTVSMATVT